MISEVRAAVTTQNFVGVHSVHALVVLVPMAAIVMALYWDRMLSAYRHHRGSDRPGGPAAPDRVSPTQPDRTE